MDIVVRKYNDVDFEQTDKLLYDTFGYYKEKMKDIKVSEFVASLDEVVVGYFNLMEEIDIIRNIKIFHVGYVCVDSAYRGKGIGKMMMEYAINYAKDNGATRMELTSGNQREASHSLYLSLGFVKRDTSVFRKEIL